MPAWADWNCDHHTLVVHGLTSPSWALGEQITAAGACGLLFPSTRHAGTNLVIYVDEMKEADFVRSYDPRRLPQEPGLLAQASIALGVLQALDGPESQLKSSFLHRLTETARLDTTYPTVADFSRMSNSDPRPGQSRSG